MDLNLSVAVLPHIGPQTLNKLEKLGINTIGDLLYHIPFRYDDLSHQSPADLIQAGEVVTLTGTLISLKNRYLRSGKTIQTGVFHDGHAHLNLTWFNQPYLVKNLVGKLLSVSGKITRYHGQLNLTSPQYELIKDSTSDLKPRIHTGRLVPVYHCTAGITNKWLRARIFSLCQNLSLNDPLYAYLKTGPTLSTALTTLHFPDSHLELKSAKKRLAFDELFYLQLKALYIKKQLAFNPKTPMQPYSKKIRDFIQTLPYQLTSSQQTVLHTILTDLTQTKPMNRLIQGDVGSGKTIIALIALYLTFLNQKLGVLLAPTEILAKQHGSTFKQLLEPLGVKISIQTKSVRESLKTNLIIGTHAVISRYLDKNIGLLVIDEEHRFGVNQRLALTQQPQIPHFLSLSATPIPRTLALSLYADLDISRLTELPPGRQKVKTWIIPESKRQACYSWIKAHHQKTQEQIYVVCPLIEEADDQIQASITSVKTHYHFLKTQFPNLRLGMVHGGMSSQTKTQVMTQFSSHQLDLLVATSVIEVGVDIPNATIMLIEGGYRFGLASLHQLRGRVGRSSAQSYCFIFDDHDPPTARLKYLETNHSGHVLAEYDLKLRGPGNIYGVSQSGYHTLRFAELTDYHTLNQTKKLAEKILKCDPNLNQSPLLKSKLQTTLALSSPPH